MEASTLLLSAVVLAAGRSTRMGRDKAVLQAEGVPLWQRQRDVLAAAGAREIFLSARPDQSWAKGAAGYAATVYDALPSRGPIVGITAGLERASQPLLAVLAIDLPNMTTRWFTELLAQSAKGVGIVGRRGEYFEPLAAIYPREMMWLAWEAIVHGENSLQRLIASAVAKGLLRVRDIMPDEEAMFVNWNRETDR